MKALVTGATGFFGRYVLAELNARRATVVTMGRRAVPNVENYRLSCVDDRDAIAAILRRAQPDSIFHLAGAPPNSSVSELELVNKVYATTLLSAVRALGVQPTIVLVGSAAEYGPHTFAAGDVSEDAPCAPSTPYGISKHGQTIEGLAAAQDGLRVVVARIFNLVGAFMPSYLALSSFAPQIATGGRPDGVLRTGNLNVERDFIAAREGARLLVELASQNRAHGHIVNLCTGIGTTLKELTELMILKSRENVRIAIDPSRVRVNDPPRAVGQTAKLRSFGLVPARPNFDEIIPDILRTARAAQSV